MNSSSAVAVGETRLSLSANAIVAQRGIYRAIPAEELDRRIISKDSVVTGDRVFFRCVYEWRDHRNKRFRSNRHEIWQFAFNGSAVQRFVRVDDVELCDR